MAIDFSQVKKIMIPEGEVTKIQINGVTVWENAPVLTSITLSGQTTSLNRGASFSFGGTVTAHYSNGSTANVTSSTTFTGYNMSKAGTYTVTASYTENGVTKTATYQLTVNKIWTTMKTNFSKTWNNSTSKGNTNVCTNLQRTQSPFKIRLTMKITTTIYNPRSQITWKGANQTTSSSSTPVDVTNKEITLTAGSLDTVLNFYCYRYLYESSIKTRVYLEVPANSNTLRLSIDTVPSEYACTMTISKVEQYY